MSNLQYPLSCIYNKVMALNLCTYQCLKAMLSYVYNIIMYVLFKYPAERKINVSISWAALSLCIVQYNICIMS